MRSYQEMVLNPMKQMCQDYDIWKKYSSRVIEGNKPLKKSFADVELTFCRMKCEIDL